MTLTEARAAGLTVFFLPTAAKAEAFARHLEAHTGRTGGHFTELVTVGKMPPFALHVTTLTPRKGTITFTRA
jgi:hypothetical protein